MYDQFTPRYWLYTDAIGNLENKNVHNMKLADVLTSLRDLLGKPSKQIVAIVLNESGRACLNYDDFMNFEHIYPEGVDVI